ncbi:hypothetical protein VTO42DRAFT_8763 [Malbranchea cinnamomea]
MGRQPIDIDFTLRRVFGKKTFRPLQREVIQAAVEGHDVFLQAATSFGKSLCFQLPAVVAHGVTVVVSPLLSLMVDQVNALEARGIPVATINSSTPPSRRRVILADILSGHPTIRLLYVTPELCQTDSFRRTLKTIHSQGELNRIAIDEAHCISEWGHDFRPAYKELSWLRRELTNPVVPITALTATATPRVRADIISLLGLDPKSLKRFSTPSARPNIHYEVRYLSDFTFDPNVPETSQVNDLLTWLQAIHERRLARLAREEESAEGAINSDTKYASNKKNWLPPMPGIIYVPLRSICNQLANSLSSSKIKIKAVAYHAGLPAAERAKIQATWASPYKPSTQTTIGADGTTQHTEEEPPAFYIVVATSAFGMGIDNPHVRFVIHWTPPRSFEGFVQESGRAGRDGRAAVSLVYYNPQERERVIDRIRRDPDGSLDTTTAGINLVGRKRTFSSLVDEARFQEAKIRNREALLESFEKVVKYCMTTDRCRHEVIREFSGDLDIEIENRKQEEAQRLREGRTGEDTEFAPTTAALTSSSVCDYACDFCKEGEVALSRRKELMAPESLPEDYIDNSGHPSAANVTGLRFTSVFDLFKGQ